ncbi:unnamed protein product [marine sediment metagenome]|uniref:DNA-directed RNA polymerase RBP11-like dimerisation domain-containing protein n=1 Tax=marine sediment metagenome TaxID=412755 RepID=X1I626_9ZZZZ
MEIKVLKESKEEIEIKFDNVTIAEILRVYLNKDPRVKFVAWRRGHPTENPQLLVKTKGKTAKRAVDSAISAITKDLDKVLTDFKKMK